MTFLVRWGRIAAIALGLGLLLGTGCKPQSPGGSSTDSPSPTATGVPSVTAPSPSASPISTIPVTIYTADEQCVNYLAKEIQVPSDRPMEAAVGQVLDHFNSPGFELTGYRVAVEGTTATVDLRLPAESPRGISSLSACEQLALFGSLHETLTQHPEWGIDTVKFTERGKAIAL